MQAQTVVRLYKCAGCAAPRYESEFNLGKRCKCGSTTIRYAEPTTMNIIRFFLNNPGMIKIYLKENVFN